MKLLFHFLLLIIFLSGLSSTASATGFPAGKNNTTLINGLFYYHANAFWDINRNLSYYDEEGYYNSLSYRVYVEHGFSTNLTGIFSAPYTCGSFQNLSFAENRCSFGDLEAGFAYRFYYPKEDFMLSAKVLFLYPAYDSSTSPVPGFGYTGIEGSLVAAGGLLLGNTGAFYQISGGFRSYFETDIWQWIYSVNAGMGLANNLELLLELSGRWSNSGEVTFNPQNIFINTNFDFHKVSAGLLWMIRPASVGILGQVYLDYSGSQVAKGRSASLSLLLIL